MRWFFGCLAICMMIFAPAAQADGYDPVAGEDVCYIYVDGSTGPCSVFPSLKYISQDAQNGSEMNRYYYFSDGSNMRMNLTTGSMDGPLSAPDTYSAWGWKSDLRRDKFRGRDLSTYVRGAIQFSCHPIIKGRKTTGIDGLRGLSCAGANKLIVSKSRKGWTCDKRACRHKKAFVYFRTVPTKDLASNFSRKSDLARFCGTYSVKTQYQVWAHDCSSVTDDTMGKWIDSGRHMGTYQLGSGCMSIDDGIHLDMGTMYGPTKDLPRDKCTQTI